VSIAPDCWCAACDELVTRRARQRGDESWREGRTNQCPACSQADCGRAWDHRVRCLSEVGLFDRLLEPKTTTGRDHPATSHYAAERILPKTGTQRSRVLEAIRRQGGLTDEEIADRLGMNPSSVRPRRQELQKAGWVEDSGDRRPTASGAQAIVWMVVEQ
jgi:hypothetical protein